MDRKQMSVVVVSVTLVLLAVTTVTASSWTSHTPLYTFRMEQASNKMNFLYTEVNDFTYTADNEYKLSYDALECCDVKPLGTCPNTQCAYTCPVTMCETTYCEATCEESCRFTSCPTECIP